MAYIRGVNRKQIILFPETVDDYITEDNPVQFIDAFIDNLNLKKLEFKHSEPASTGRPPYNPADLLKLYIYGYLNRSQTILILPCQFDNFSTGQAPWVLEVSDVLFLLIVHPKALESGTRHRGNTRRTSGPPATLASTFSP